MAILVQPCNVHGIILDPDISDRGGWLAPDFFWATSGGLPSGKLT
jgi:hypothetical protein